MHRALAGPAAAVATFLAALLLLAACVDAKIEYARVFRDDRPLITVTQPFGFGSRGHIDITIKDITLWRHHDQVNDDYNLANFGFFLSSWDAEAALSQDLLSHKCLLDDRELKLFNFADRKVQSVIARKVANATSRIDIKDGGMFYLYFANCERATPVSFDARVEMYNLVGPNDRRDYLSVGETELSVMYWIMFAWFASIGIAWGVLLLRGQKHTVHSIHWLMLALVIFKTLTVMAQAVMFQVIQARGTAHGWNWVFYFFTLFRGLLFFSVVVLIGTGWSYMKPFIDDRTRKVLLVVIPLQVFANIAIVVTSEESPAIRDWFTWQDIFHFVDILCCCAILFPIVWSIKHLRDAAATDGKAARMLEKLTLFRQFYVMVVVFIYFTRIVVYLLENTLEYRYRWLGQAANELAVLAFYVWVGVRFRPNADNPYTKLHQEELEMA